VNIFGIKERINMKPIELNNAWEFKHVDGDGKVVTMNFEADTWPEVLNNFMSFLRGSGYHYLTEKSVAINQKLHPFVDYCWDGEFFWPDEEPQGPFQVGCTD
jgi:hypothetical protein